MCGSSEVEREFMQARGRRFESFLHMEVFLTDEHKGRLYTDYVQPAYHEGKVSSMAEQWTHNPRVAGSNPAPCTMVR